MLVLSRQKDESIVIGTGADRVEVTVIDVRGDKVRLGCSAPRNVPVHRKEVAQAIEREARASAAAASHILEEDALNPKLAKRRKD